MNTNSYKIANGKLVDIFVQGITFPIAMWALRRFSMNGSGAEMVSGMAIAYLWGAIQMISCIVWMFVLRPGRFQKVFLATGVILLMCAVAPGAFLLASILMLLAGPVLGITYFFRTVSDYRKYKSMQDE